MIFHMYRIRYAMSVHYEHHSGQSKKNVRTLFPPKNRQKIHISINVDYLLTPSVSMFIEGLSLEARHAAQAERLSANTATASASAAAAGAAERASSVSPPFFALSPPAKMDSIASLPTPASADEPTPAIAGSLAPLVYAEDFIEGGRWWGGGALAGR
jgi:hypothetical protein